MENKYNWKDILVKTIQQLTESEYRKVIFISSCDNYNTYITQLSKEIQYEVIHPKL